MSEYVVRKSILGFLQPTMPAPDYTCKAFYKDDFVEITPSMYEGKYVVLFFYPMDFTFVCPTEIIAFAERAPEFRKIECEVIASSCDSVYSHYAWSNTPRKVGGLGSVDIPLLADKSGRVARHYGVYNDDMGIAYRGLFIIDRDGIIRQMTINDIGVGRNVDETLRLVQAFQYVDIYGEVCPANWKPGGDTIKTNPEESLQYFQTNVNE